MDELEAALSGAPEGAAARRYLAAAKAAGRRDDAVRFLSELYRKTRAPELWDVLRDAFTAPELEGLAPPEATTAGPEKEPRLARRPYRELVLSAFRAPVANASSIFVLAVSGPLVLGAQLAMAFLGCVGLGIAAFLFGYVFGFLFDVARQAAEGHARGPRLDSLLWSDESRFAFVAQFLNWLGAVFATFWPVLVLTMATRENAPAWGPVGVVLSLLLSAWLPIALLRALYGGGFASFNYAASLARIRRLGGDYAICAALFLGTTFAVYGLQAAINAWAGEIEERRLPALMFIGWATVASWFVQMRAIGLLAWTRTTSSATPES